MTRTPEGVKRIFSCRRDSGAVHVCRQFLVCCEMDHSTLTLSFPRRACPRPDRGRESTAHEGPGSAVPGFLLGLERPSAATKSGNPATCAHTSQGLRLRGIASRTHFRGLTTDVMAAELTTWALLLKSSQITKRPQSGCLQRASSYFSTAKVGHLTRHRYARLNSNATRVTTKNAC
jgi:hypothetical protein